MDIKDEFLYEYTRFILNLKARNTIFRTGYDNEGEAYVYPIDDTDDKKEKSKEKLKQEQKQIYQDILKAKKAGDKEKHKKLLDRYYQIEKQLKDEQQKEKSKNPSITKKPTEEKQKIKLAGVDAGAPMSRDKADNGNPNPNYMKKNGCTTNCQTCVVAYEARLRGYDVQALGNYKNPTIKVLSHRTNSAWVDPKTGGHPKYIEDASVKNSKTCYAWLDKEIKQGNRYTLEFGWKGRRHSGHIVSIDKDENNNLRLYDPQNGKTTTDKTELLRYFGRFKYQMSTYGLKFPSPPKVLRVDNMDFNTDVVDKILEKSN